MELYKPRAYNRNLTVVEMKFKSLVGGPAGFDSAIIRSVNWFQINWSMNECPYVRIPVSLH